jgi:hypothetical protein
VWRRGGEPGGGGRGGGNGRDPEADNSYRRNRGGENGWEEEGEGSGGRGVGGEALALVGVAVDRGGTPAFYCYGKREGYLKIEDGYVVVYGAFLLRETLRNLHFSWDQVTKGWKLGLNQALRVLNVDILDEMGGEGGGGGEDDDVRLTRALAQVHRIRFGV